MNSILQAQQRKKILVSDGAWGTFLQQKGLQIGECPESWNITHPDAVYDIAKSYIEAGADIIETNSFGGNSFKLNHYSLQHMVAEINEAAAAISRKAAGNNAFVIGSVGPTGKILMMGEVTEDELYNSFKEQIVALEKGGVDAICIETMSDIDEAIIAIKAAKQNTKCEIICTFTFQKTVNNDYRTMMGVSPSDIINPLIDSGADIIGANCGNGIERMIDIVCEIRKCNQHIPILIHANAGLPQLKNDITVFSETPEIMANHVPQLINAGATIIGGCCGTTPLHIKAIANSVKNYLS